MIRMEKKTTFITWSQRSFFQGFLPEISPGTCTRAVPESRRHETVYQEFYEICTILLSNNVMNLYLTVCRRVRSTQKFL